MVTSIVLALALVITGVVVLSTLGGLHGTIGTLKAQRTAQLSADAQAQAKLHDDFQAANLSAKLGQVRDLTTAAQQALLDWNAQAASLQASTIHTVQEAINKCDLAVFDYDNTAAKFPASLLAGLPTAIDTNDQATDCGRIN
jgi:hypothetical protein